MFKRFYITLIFVFGSFLMVAQKGVDSTFIDSERELNKFGYDIINGLDDESREAANTQFHDLLLEVVSSDHSFDYRFDSLKTISILTAGNVKLYNWMLPMDDGTYRFFAFLQTKVEENHYTVIELIDQSDEIKLPENKILTPKNWYGALYYQIIHDKKIGKNEYTLLGWDGNNNLTNKKIIDVMVVSGNGMVKFGASIFKMKRKTKRRVIFEYSKSAVMSLKYHPNEKKIVFDYLVPVNSNLSGIFEYYGPSLNRFDAFVISPRKWLYEPDTEIKLRRNLKDNFYNSPN